jgi:putative colanic acid biosynthesis acetyltransferase WcaF
MEASMNKPSGAAVPPSPIPVINLAEAPGEGKAWDRPKAVVFLWAAVELLVIHNPWQPSSTLRTKALRLFGAKVGQQVLIRPRVRIKFPWKLTIGDRCWLGEGVWIHNQDIVTIGNDVVVSQEAFVTTGSHALATDMALITKPVILEDGCWLSTRSMVLGGAVIGRSAVIAPNVVVPPNMKVEPNDVLGLQQPIPTRKRFR